MKVKIFTAIALYLLVACNSDNQENPIAPDDSEGFVSVIQASDHTTLCKAKLEVLYKTDKKSLNWYLHRGTGKCYTKDLICQSIVGLEY